MTTTTASPTDYTRDRAPDRWQHARVAWFDGEKGFGFLTPDAGPAVFLDYQVIEVPGYKTLTAGQHVIYTATDTPRGPEATRVVPYPRTSTTPAPAQTPRIRSQRTPRHRCRAPRRAA
ncbi:cold shock domain-containing protein [Nocardia sp. NPDC052001]|uniref:cold-shock protein n=1 Tax=Nocardia sp. NPDC052001 TaxID=3154853 RepID=UPI0034296CC5